VWEHVIKTEVKEMRLLLVSAVLVLALALTGVAFASVPDAGTSTVEREGQGSASCNPDTAVVCPASDMGSVMVTVTVRNRYGDPLPSKSVDCWAEEITGTFCWCPGESLQTDTTGPTGEAFFFFTDFGGCGDIQFGAQCEGVMFTPSPTIFVASPDINGDCAVNAIDFSLFASSYGTADPCCNYNCDGAVDAVDFSLFAQHYGHVCP
jgi:hypothetical protein